MTSTHSIPESSSASTNLPQATTVQPYLFFEGRCEEALEFYKRAAGATVTMLMRYRENPTPQACEAMPPGDKVMHATFRIGDAHINASDGNCSGKATFEGFAVSLTVPSPAEAERLYHAMSQGGQVIAPIGPTFFSPKFGMFKDRFGVMWMVYVAPKQA